MLGRRWRVCVLQTFLAATGCGTILSLLCLAYTSAPWQCLNLRPEPHGQGALRCTLPQVAGSFGSTATAGSRREIRCRIGSPGAISSSPVNGLMCEACIG